MRKKYIHKQTNLPFFVSNTITKKPFAVPFIEYIQRNLFLSLSPYSKKLYTLAVGTLRAIIKKNLVQKSSHLPLNMRVTLGVLAQAGPAISFGHLQDSLGVGGRDKLCLGKNLRSIKSTKKQKNKKDKALPSSPP